MAVLPAEIPTGLVTGHYYFVNEDNIDEDTDPELTVVTGTVRFTASVKTLRMPSKKAVLVPLTFDGVFDSQGNLTPLKGTGVGMELPATNSPLFSEQDYTWRVEFNLKEAGTTNTVNLDSFDIQVPVGSTQDLSVLIPVNTSPGTITLRGPQGDKGDKGPAGTADDASMTEVLEDSGSEFSRALSGTIAAVAEGKLDTATAGATVVASGAIAAGSFGKVLVLGTSIANATGATTVAKGYATLLAAKTSALLQGTPVTSIPAGRNGDTSGQMYVRLRALLELHRPAYVFIETSINDTRDDLPITPAQTVENVRASVSMVRMFGATPIVGTSAPISPAQFGAPYSAQSVTEQGQTNALVKGAMAELGVQVVDLFASYQGVPQNLTDGIHPNDTGHDQWATNIARAIAGRTLTVYVPPVQPYSADTFSRANNVALGNTEIGVQAWETPYPAGWVISGNSLLVSATTLTGLQNDCLVNDAHADGTFTLTRVSNSSMSGLAFRISADGATGYLVYRLASNYILAKRTTAAGAYTTLATSAGIAPAVGDVIKVVVNGSSIKASINETQFADVTDASYTGIRHGAWTSGGVASSFDNWEHTPLP